MAENSDTTVYLTLMLYGVRADDITGGRFIRFVGGLFKELGHPPDCLGIHRVAGSKKTRGFYPMPVRPLRTQLLRGGFRDVTSIDIVTLQKNGRYPGEDYLLMGSWHREPHYALIAAPLNLVPDTNEWCQKRAMEMIKFLRPEYGCGYLSGKNFRPAQFTAYPGLGDGMEEDRRNNWWGMSAVRRKLWQKGVIRDVFRWNFISEGQLQQKMGRASLRQWIVSDVGRGELHPFSHGMTLWCVPDDRIPAIRKTLHYAGVVFDHHRHTRYPRPA